MNSYDIKAWNKEVRLKEIEGRKLTGSQQVNRRIQSNTGDCHSRINKKLKRLESSLSLSRRALLVAAA